MRTSPITVTEQDARRLFDLVNLYVDREPDAAVSLVEELERARVVAANELAPSIVTMNSRVTCRDERGEPRVVEVVYPVRADLAQGRVSVLAPLGRALLGASVGDRVVVRGRGRETTWTVESVEYQPEAAGDYHL